MFPSPTPLTQPVPHDSSVTVLKTPRPNPAHLGLHVLSSFIAEERFDILLLKIHLPGAILSPRRAGAVEQPTP